MRDRWKLSDDRILRGEVMGNAGDTVYRASGYDYGLARDDTFFTGEEHISVTINADGSGPSFTVPVSILEEFA